MTVQGQRQRCRTRPRFGPNTAQMESRTDIFPPPSRAVYSRLREGSMYRSGALTAWNQRVTKPLGDGRKCSVMLTLREARLRRRMSQQLLADRAGVARVTVSQIELGKSGPRPHIARRIAEALDTAPSDIVEFRAAAESMQLPAPTILAALENDAQNPA